MKFIDLFAGLGGFHLALSKAGHECVFACELDETLRSVYELNFGIEPAADIRNVDVATEVPEHDILCAGFPCQPFSKAGEQQGFEDPRWSGLFRVVLEILRERKPRFFIMENVPNLQRHNGGATWQWLKQQLTRAPLKYDISSRLMSPHQFGIPQVRERLFIVGAREGLGGFSWPEPSPETPTPALSTILEQSPSNARRLTPQVEQCLTVWQEFLDAFPKSAKLPSFPIWSMEFGATYPYEGLTPFVHSAHQLRKYRGSHGVHVAGATKAAVMLELPSHARTRERRFPHWKVKFIEQNRELYAEHKAWLDKWKPKILAFPPSLQKFEWNCQGEERDIWKYVIQFRASGVRVKRPTTAPSLVAMTTTQVPIVAWERRYMTEREAASLQSMDELEHLPSASTRAFAALGNAVNAKLVRWIVESLTTGIEEPLSESEAELVAV
jgi:DNA (cytosine-5)-methyltransferase 1